ncbi:hypothetical protein BZA70DRAFT_286752 [Myxozyma melibiosi]|uniref:DUF1348-domain-containing protein n=1 Tax=Myxozyma melibiosi TaxID=54550 RepID=A0ABR1FEC4_9ASCO
MSAIVPPFTLQTAIKKVKVAQDLWNTRNPAKVAAAYSPNSLWRNRTTFVHGTAEIEKFLTDKWNTEKQYRLRKELFTYTGNEIAVNFWYEWNNGRGQWFRTYGLEHWTFGEDGKMTKRQMCGNDLPIEEADRWFPESVEDVNTVVLPEV